MSNATLRAVGGSVMVALPKPSLERLNLSPGSRVNIAVDRGKVTLTPIAKPQYSLEEVLSQCGRNAFRKSRADSDWLADRLVGKEAV